MLVRRVDAQGTLLVGGEVIPYAIFERELCKSFPCLAYVKRFTTPARRKQAQIAQMGAGIDADIFRLKLPLVAIFFGCHHLIGIEAQQRLAHVRDKRRIVVVILTFPRAGTPTFADNEVTDEGGGVVLLFRRRIKPVVLAKCKKGVSTWQWLEALHHDPLRKARRVVPALPLTFEVRSAEHSYLFVAAGLV